MRDLFEIFLLEISKGDLPSVPTPEQIERRKENTKRWQQAHPERVKEINKRYMDRRGPEQIARRKENNRVYYLRMKENDPERYEKRREYNREYYQRKKAEAEGITTIRVGKDRP